MNCTNVSEKLPHYLAGECDAATRAAIERHAAACPACAREIATQRRLDDTLRQAFAEQALELRPLRERVRAAIRPPEKRRWFPGWQQPWQWASLAAALVVFGALGAFYLTGQRAETRLYQAAIKDHIDDAVTLKAKQGWRADPAEVKAFALEQFGTDEFLAKLAPPDFELRRVRMCNLQGDRFAHFIYSAGGREVSFFVRKRSDPLRGPVVETVRGLPLFADARDAYQVAGFETARLTVLIVTDLPPAENLRLAREAAGRLS